MVVFKLVNYCTIHTLADISFEGEITPQKDYFALFLDFIHKNQNYLKKKFLYTYILFIGAVGF